jgi:hypothetical protein
MASRPLPALPPPAQSQLISAEIRYCEIEVAVQKMKLGSSGAARMSTVKQMLHNLGTGDYHGGIFELVLAQAGELMDEIEQEMGQEAGHDR